MVMSFFKRNSYERSEVPGSAFGFRSLQLCRPENGPIARPGKVVFYLCLFCHFGVSHHCVPGDGFLAQCQKVH